MSRVKVTDPGSWRRLGVDPGQLGRLSTECGRTGIDKLRATAKENFRTLARQLHPDLHDGCKIKTAELAMLANANDEIQDLQYVAPAPLPRPASGGSGILVILPGGFRIYVSGGGIDPSAF